MKKAVILILTMSMVATAYPSRSVEIQQQQDRALAIGVIVALAALVYAIVRPTLETSRHHMQAAKERQEAIEKRCRKHGHLADWKIYDDGTLRKCRRCGMFYNTDGAWQIPNFQQLTPAQKCAIVGHESDGADGNECSRCFHRLEEK